MSVRSLGDEVGVAARWLRAALYADAELVALASVGGTTNIGFGTLANLPGVTYSYQGGDDLRGNDAVRIWSSHLWLVKAVCRGVDFATAHALAERIDAVLDGQGGMVVGGTVTGCWRERQIAYVQTDGDQAWQHLGGEYRLYAQTEGVA